jgi:hypothetical protein
MTFICHGYLARNQKAGNIENTNQKNKDAAIPYPIAPPIEK